MHQSTPELHARTLGGLVLVLSVICTARAGEPRKSLDIGERAPQWLVESETYAFSTLETDFAALAASKVAFVTHCPLNREYFARLHALGIRAIPYVTFYQGRADSTYEGVNLKDHPDFIEVDEQGNRRRTSFWESEDAKNMYVICPACPEYQDAMCAWVGKMMELGADGVFVDNLSARAPCFGGKLGIHKHTSDDANQAFAMLLARVRKVIKGYKPDGAVLGNSGNPTALPHEFWKSLDAEMLESYICTWASKDRWFDWKTHWHQEGVNLQPFIAAGKQVQALSYLGSTPYGMREDGFYCYASARLAGLVWNGGRESFTDANTAILYQIRLGTPRGPEQQEGGAYFRLFERGLVAVNPDKNNPAAVTLPPSVSSPLLDDLFTHPSIGAKPTTQPIIDLHASKNRITIPPFSGRVYLFAGNMKDELDHPGPTLTLTTNPPLGEVRFKVDGFDYWTKSGMWTTKYVLGPDFGKFHITFDGPGKHTIEIVDRIPAAMKTPAGYATSERLGQFMDPAQPTTAATRKFSFRQWTGPSSTTQPTIEIEIKTDTALEADFSVEAMKK